MKDAQSEHPIKQHSLSERRYASLAYPVVPLSFSPLHFCFKQRWYIVWMYVTYMLGPVYITAVVFACSEIGRSLEASSQMDAHLSSKKEIAG